MTIHIAGVDEVGRGPLAGPVVTGAVILDPHYHIEGLVDSKQLSPRKREKIAEEIRQHALSWAIGRAEVKEIEQINILQASLLAMRRAVLALSQVPDEVLVDGNHYPTLPYPCSAIIRGDQTVAAISAASIIAKVARDQEMVAMDKKYPGYGFASHKGYPTKKHIAALEKLGITVIHRRSYKPVRRILEVKTL